MSSQTSENRPISRRRLIRILVLIIIILAFTAGYYQSAYKLEIKKLNRLRDKYNIVEQDLDECETSQENLEKIEQMLGKEQVESLINQTE